MSKLKVTLFGGMLGVLLLSGCGLTGTRDEPHGIATTSLAICEILDRLGIDEVVGVLMQLKIFHCQNAIKMRLKLGMR